MKVFNKNKALRQIKLKQNKNTYIKRISIVLSCFILLIGIMYFTFAKFEQNSEEYTLINGKVKYLGGDINIVSYNYDGNVNSEPPNKNEGYILTNINCEGATGEWDDVNWELNISSLTSKVKCNLEFDKNSNYQIIKYNTNGGYLEEQYKKGEVGDQIGNLPTPVRAGYTFEGWYKESALTNKVETTTTIDSTITNLYAKYTENTITINTLGESNVLDYAKANFTLPSGDGYKVINFNTPANHSGNYTIDCGIENPDLIGVFANTTGFDWSIYLWTNNYLQYSSCGIMVARSKATRSGWTPIINGSILSLPGLSASGNYNLVVVKKI